MKKVLFLIVFFLGSIQAQQVALTDSLPFNPEIRRGTLSNGLTYFIRQNLKPEKRAEFRLVVKAGSVLEDEDQQGLAHFVEHMAFNGTRRFPRQALINYLERTGVQFGPHLNAYTSFDETVYMLQVPTDSQDVFRTAFRVLEDWAGGISFDAGEVDKERGVVIEEWRMGKGAFERIEDIHNPKLFYNSQYALRLPIGKKDVLDTAHVETLKRFYRDWYRPDLMSVIAVGDFDVAEVERRIVEHFAGLRNPSPPRPRPTYKLPDHEHTLVSVARDKELPYPSLNLYFKRDVRPDKTVADYREGLIQQLYIYMLSARLDERTQRSNPPFVYSAAGNFNFVGGKQAFGLFAILREDAILEGLGGLMEEARRVRQHGFTASELDREKANLMRLYEKSLAEKSKTESGRYADELVRHVVEEESVPGIDFEFRIVRTFLPGITLDEVNDLTARRMGNKNRVVTVSMPVKDGLAVPDSAAIMAALDDATAVEAYADHTTDHPLTTFPEAVSIPMKSKRHEKIGVTEWKLPNGARVVFKQTEFKNDEVLFRAFSPGGTSLVSDSEHVTTTFASQLVTASGLGNYDAVGLGKYLSGRLLRLTPFIGELSEGLGGSSSPKDLETLMQMVYAYFTDIRPDSEAIGAYLTNTRSFLQNWRVSPENAFSDTLQSTLARYHFRRRPMSPELLDEIDVDAAFRIFRDRISDASDFTFLFVGNVDEETLRELCGRYLATLSSAKRKERFKDIGVRPPTGLVSKTLYKGVEPKAQVQLVFTGPYQDSYKNRVNFNLMISVLDIKLREVLREEKGGVYGVEVYGSPSIIPYASSTVNIGFTCDPGRVEELIGETLTQLDSLKSHPLPAGYLEKVQAQQLRQREINLKDNQWWIGVLQNSYWLGTDPNKLLDFEKQLEKWKASDFQKDMKTYFGPNRIRIVLLPEE